MYILNLIGHKIKSFIVLCLLCLIVSNLVAQYDETIEDPQWIPTLLNSKSSILFELAQYNGWPISWVQRGHPNGTKIIMNGIDWKTNLPHFNANAIYAGLYEIQTKEQLAEQFEFTSNGFGNRYNNQYVSSFASVKRKQQKLTIGWSDNGRMVSLGLAMNTGKRKNNWVIQSYLNTQQNSTNDIPGGFRKNIVAAISADKMFKRHQDLNMLAWVTDQHQGRRSMATEELFNITNNHEYNAAWGWYHGKAWYPNTRHHKIIAFQLTYIKRWLDESWLQTSFGIMTGSQTQRSLEWASAKDPRPDYYKYLPSYFSDTLLSASLLKAYLNNPFLLQLNGDLLEKANLASQSGKSLYIVNANMASPLIAKWALDYLKPVFKNGQIDAHCLYAREQIRYNNTVDQLLGGQFFYNYNSWVNDDGSADYFQNNILVPDKKIKENEKWGPDYILVHNQLKFSTQLKWELPKWEWSLGGQIEYLIFQRNGFNQNGLFPEASFGFSHKYIFPAYGMKGQGLYKISGRHYLQSIFFDQSEAPLGNTVFINPSLQSTMSDFVRPVKHTGGDLSYIYRGVPLKARFTIYKQFTSGVSGHSSFYHDNYNAFVYGVYGEQKEVREGFECMTETQLMGSLECKLSISYNHSIIANQPVYEIKLMNDLFKLESGSLAIKNLPASTSPEWVYACSMSRQIGMNTRVGLTTIYAKDRFMHYDYFRRSSFWADKITSTLNSSNYLKVANLPDQFMLNIFLATSFPFFTRQQKMSAILNVRNSLHSTFPTLAAESSRFDYKDFNLNKFPVKYLYEEGTHISLRLQLQFL